MAWEVEYTDEFARWWDTLSEYEQIALAASVRQLEDLGPMLPFPHSSSVRGSRHGVMRELRIRSGGKPVRVFYAFDERRTALLLVGGKKGGNKRFYDQFLRVADRLFDEHLAELRTAREKEATHDRTSSVRGASGEDVTRGKGARGSKS
jgi:hypothetical protein